MLSTLRSRGSRAGTYTSRNPTALIRELLPGSASSPLSAATATLRADQSLHTQVGHPYCPQPVTSTGCILHGTQLSLALPAPFLFHIHFLSSCLHLFRHFLRMFQLVQLLFHTLCHQSVLSGCHLLQLSWHSVCVSLFEQHVSC